MHRVSITFLKARGFFTIDGVGGLGAARWQICDRAEFIYRANRPIDEAL
jgi:hypothetical protein